MLIRIDAPWFCAGVLLDHQGRVINGAPILNYMRGWTGREVVRYARGRGWTVRVI